MLTASLAATPLWQPFVTSPILRDSLAWIDEHAASAPEGIHELGQPGWFVNVHGYTTKPEADCVWENHLATIDVQYLMAGREGIRVGPVEKLGPIASFKAESDTQKFAGGPHPGHLLDLGAGDFVIFLPGEAHCPKIAIGEPSTLRKLVIKVPLALLTS